MIHVACTLLIRVPILYVLALGYPPNPTHDDDDDGRGVRRLIHLALRRLAAVSLEKFLNLASIFILFKN